MPLHHLLVSFNTLLFFPKNPKLHLSKKTKNPFLFSKKPMHRRRLQRTKQPRQPIQVNRLQSVQKGQTNRVVKYEISGRATDYVLELVNGSLFVEMIARNS